MALRRIDRHRRESTAMNMFANHKKMFRCRLDTVDSPFAYTLITAQTETERVLTEHLTRSAVTVDRGTMLAVLRQDADAVHLTLQHADGKRPRRSTPRGHRHRRGHSSVRRMVGTKLQGSFKGERFIPRCRGRTDFDNTNMYTYFDADGPVVTLRCSWAGAVPGHRSTTPWRPAECEPHDRTASEDHRRTHRGRHHHHSPWVTCFEIHHGQVPEYRHGRVFLAATPPTSTAPPVARDEHRHAGRLQPVLEAREVIKATPEMRY